MSRGLRRCDYAQKYVKNFIFLFFSEYAKIPRPQALLGHLLICCFNLQDYEKVQHLALHAFHNTENEAIQAESCYQLARSFHIQVPLFDISIITWGGDCAESDPVGPETFKFMSPNNKRVWNFRSLLPTSRECT